MAWSIVFEFISNTSVHGNRTGPDTDEDLEVLL